MNENNKATVLCLGHDENALIFNASGISGIVINDVKELNDVVKDHVNSGIKIFLISEKFSEEVSELRLKYEGVYPIFLLLSLDGTNSDIGVERIRKDVERATGINLF